MPVLLGTIGVSLTVSGCVTQSALEVGSAHEYPTGYREVLLSGATLQLHYNTEAYFSGLGGPTTIENPPDRRSTVGTLCARRARALRRDGRRHHVAVPGALLAHAFRAQPLILMLLAPVAFRP